MIKELIGKKVLKVYASDEDVTFITDHGTYRMYHDQDCCETVYVEDICGDLQDLVGEVVLDAREETSRENGKECDDSFTWTFYIIRCNKCSITIRWYGSSNGYYSERVDFEKQEETK